MVEGGAQLEGQHLELDVVAHHGQHVLLQHDEALLGQPDDVVDELERLGLGLGVEPLLLARGDELLRQVEREAQDLEQHRREQRVVGLDGPGKLAKELLVDFRRSHGCSCGGSQTKAWWAAGAGAVW